MTILTSNTFRVDVGTLTVNSDTFHSIGIRFTIDDTIDPADSSCAVEYKKTTDGVYLNATDLLRIYDHEAFFTGSESQGLFNEFGGSIMFLTPGTNYDVRLTFTVGGEVTSIMNFQTATRAIPVKPIGGNTYYVDPDASSGGDGDSSTPFMTIEEADGVVVAGDIVKLRDGTYPQTLITLNNGGSEAGGYVLYEPDTGASPVLYRIELQDSYIWFDNLEFLGIDGVTNNLSDLFLYDDAAIFRNTVLPTNIVVTGCDFSLFNMGIFLTGGANHTIMDNTGVGPGHVDAGSGSFFIRTGGESTSNSPGSVVAYNKATLYSDNINIGSDSDAYGNDSIDATDDGLSSDAQESNVKSWGNRITDWNYYAHAFQPQTCGPWYFLYNQYIGTAQPFKLKWPDRNVFINNTFIVPLGQFGRHYLRMIVKNNLVYRDDTNVVMNGTYTTDDLPSGNRGSQLAPDWNSDIDHNGYGNNGGNLIGYDHDSNGSDSYYSTLALYRDAVNLNAVSPTTVEDNSIEIASTEWSNFAGRDETTHLDLQSGSVAIGAGISIDNLADWHNDPPDMGYRQFGEAELQFGPRTSELGTALHLRTDNWSKH